MSTRLLDKEEAGIVLAIYRLADKINMDVSLQGMDANVCFMPGGAIEIECAHSDQTESFESESVFVTHYDLGEALAVAHYEAMARDAKAGVA